MPLEPNTHNPLIWNALVLMGQRTGVNQLKKTGLCTAVSQFKKRQTNVRHGLPDPHATHLRL